MLSVPPDDPIVVGGMLRPDVGAGGFEGGRGVEFLSLQVSRGGTRVELPSRGESKGTLLAAYFCSTS